MKKPLLITGILFTGLFLLLISCQKEETPIIKEKLTGFVQKGPFINGTSITISELDNNLAQTGKTFSAQIIDNEGSFELNGISLESRYVELKADGFYFNEIQGKTSDAQLTLYALTDLSDRDNVNVNVLTHLEKQRVQYLISQGTSFKDAKKQSQEEILRIFEIENNEIGESETLDITGDGDDDAILLAVSVILQGYRTEAELSELLATIAGDLREDGTLDNEAAGSALINHAKYMNMSKIREKLENRYKDIGSDATIPDFKKFVDKFVDSTGFEFTHFINYPQWSDYGENILYEGLNTIHTGNYSMAAELPPGSDLKVVLSGGLWGIRIAPGGPINWTISQYNYNTHSQVFKIIEPGKDCDLWITFMGDEWVSDSLRIEFYENAAEQPTKVTKIHISDKETPRISYPISPINILYEENDTFYVDDYYKMEATIPTNAELKIILHGASNWEVASDQEIVNWSSTPFDNQNSEQVFFTNTDGPAYLTIYFNNQGEVEVEYEENVNNEYFNTFSRNLFIIDNR